MSSMRSFLTIFFWALLFGSNFGAPPTEFDARKQWPHCMFPVRDQGEWYCWISFLLWQKKSGSVLLDDLLENIDTRLCIESQSNILVNLSRSYVTNCCSNCGTGNCGGEDGKDRSSFWVINPEQAVFVWMFENGTITCKKTYFYRTSFSSMHGKFAKLSNQVCWWNEIEEILRFSLLQFGFCK